MTAPFVRVPLIALLALVLAAPPSEAIAPVIAMLAKQLLKDAITSSVKSSLMGGLRGMGCKGAALANAVST
ncbi:MAG TPA: hypothetical protein VJ608_13575, partial [Albitalea sp.]|nr:hypothetical protein [Albitalea sp.]